MAVVERIRCVAQGVFRLDLVGLARARAGQFFMLRSELGMDPFLPRPISAYDSEGDVTSFVFRVAGRGTAAFSRLVPGERVEAVGPLGNGFDFSGRDAVFVAGGVGLAPLHFALKTYKRTQVGQARVYLGFSGDTFCVDDFRTYADAIELDVGGTIVDSVQDSDADYYCCGPEPMMRALAAKIPDRPLFCSLERKMACGVGACLSCSVKCRSGMKRVCSDGPVFDADEVFR